MTLEQKADYLLNEIKHSCFKNFITEKIGHNNWDKVFYSFKPCLHGQGKDINLGIIFKVYDKTRFLWWLRPYRFVVDFEDCSYQFTENSKFPKYPWIHDESSCLNLYIPSLAANAYAKANNGKDIDEMKQIFITEMEKSPYLTNVGVDFKVDKSSGYTKYESVRFSYTSFLTGIRYK